MNSENSPKNGPHEVQNTDEQLVLLTLENKDSYAYLVDRYEGKLRRYIRRISGWPNEDIDDVLQDIFIKAYRNLRGFESNLKFSSWIYRIAHNEAIDHFRKMKARPAALDPEANEEMFEKLHDDSDLVEELDSLRQKETLLGAIQLLEEKYRNVIILHYMEEKDYIEISAILKKPMGTVATLLRRAKKRLKENIIQNHVPHN